MAVWSQKYSYVFNLAPKTASRSVRLFLERYYDARLYRNHHSFLIMPKPAIHCGTVRNPYTRMLSFWLFHTQKKKKAEISFAECLKHLRIPRHSSQVKFYQSRMDFFVRFEHIDDDMSLLPFISKKVHVPTMEEWWNTNVPFFSCPKTGGKRRKPARPGLFNEIYAEKVNVRALMDHSGEDFDAFGYSTEVPHIENF